MPRKNGNKSYRRSSASVYSSAWGSDGELKPVAHNKVRWPTETRTLVHPKGHLKRSVLTPKEAQALKQQLKGD